MEYYKGRLCVSMRELVKHGIMTAANYRQMARRGRFEVAQQGRGLGNYAFAVIDTLPTKYREQVREKLGNGDEVLAAGWFRDNYELDQAAVAWFNDRSNTGIDMKPAKVVECVINASVLNCCVRLHSRASDFQRILGNTCQWEKMAKAVESLREQFGHTLPTSMFRFRKKVAQYKKEGFASLVSGKFGNTNVLKHNKD